MNLFSLLADAPDSQRHRCEAGRWSARIILVALLIAMLTMAPKARADGDDDGSDTDAVAESSPPDSSSTDPSMANQVLEIPQQCDQDAVASLCDRSTDASIAADEDESLANEPDPGSLYDYANQNIINDASSTGTTNLPVGVFAPEYMRLSPAPNVVSPQLIGPGAYQQWASGPGTYQQFAPDPGFIAPMPLGYHPYFGPSFAPHPFHSFSAARFGRR
jgi:hypothetical protein